MAENEKINLKFFHNKIRDFQGDIPGSLPILPLKNSVAFPFQLIPIIVGLERSLKLIKDVVNEEGLLGIVSVEDPEIEEPGPGEVFETGTVARIEHVLSLPEQKIQIIAQGLIKFRIDSWIGGRDYLFASILLSPDREEKGLEVEAMHRNLRELTREVIMLSPEIADNISLLLPRLTDPLFMTYLVAGNSGLDVNLGQQLLEEGSVKRKMRILLSHLQHEKEVLSLSKKIQTETKGEIDRMQKEFFLRQQLKTIKKQLGESGKTLDEFSEYREKIQNKMLPEEAQKEANHELKRLESSNPYSAEFNVIKNN